MPVTALESKVVPFQLSFDAGTTYKNVVCKISGELNFNRPLNRTPTDCGSYVAAGALEWGGSYEGMVNTTPTSLTELSAEDILGAVVNATAVLARVAYPAPATGTDLYAQGPVQITNLSIRFQNGEVLIFSFDFEGTGDVDHTP